MGGKKFYDREEKFSDGAISACEALLADKVTDVGTPGGSRRDSLRLRLGDRSFLASDYFTTSPRGTVANGTAPPSVT